MNHGWSTGSSVRRVSFTVGVAALLGLQHVMTATPERFGALYGTLYVLLTLARYHRYQKLKEHVCCIAFLLLLTNRLTLMLA